MNLNHLRMLFFCGQHRTFSEAARAMFLTPQAVSMQIKQMEADIGIVLFQRQGKAVELTDAGRILFECAKKIFALTEEANNTVMALKDVKTGVLRIGTPKGYARYIMYALISAYQEKYPGIRVVLEEGNAMDVTKALIDHKNELGLISTITPCAPLIEVIPFSREELLLVLPSGHPLTGKEKIFLKDLVTESLIVREKGALSRECIMDKFQAAGIIPHILAEGSNFAFIVDQVRAGKGISFMPKSLLEGQLKDGLLKVRSLAEGPFMIDNVIVYLKNRTLSPAARAFINMMIEGKDP